jgi:hypothetical protein
MPCPACDSPRVRPSRPRGGREAFLRVWSRTRYHECKECGWRARLPRTLGDSANDLPDVRFWTVAALVGMGFVYVLLRVR